MDYFRREFTPSLIFIIWTPPYFWYGFLCFVTKSLSGICFSLFIAIISINRGCFLFELCTGWSGLCRNWFWITFLAKNTFPIIFVGEFFENLFFFIHFDEVSSSLSPSHIQVLVHSHIILQLLLRAQREGHHQSLSEWIHSELFKLKELCIRQQTSILDI